MFKHILLPVDGSRTSLAAGSRAAGLAKALGAKVTALYVIDPYPFTGVGAENPEGRVAYLSAANSEADYAMKTTSAALKEAGVEADCEVTESNTSWRGVLDAAKTVGADLIVMGSHGRRGLEKLVIGSVAQRVVAHADVSVLVVRDPGVSDD
jgi:nucleotide-binding universal stress UspA family protein